MGMESPKTEGQDKKSIKESDYHIQKAEDFIAKNFHSYLDDLGLSEADIKNKRVLDVGAGARTFASHCIRTGINREIYSLKPRIGETYPEEEKEITAIIGEKEKKEIDSKTVKAVMENMPFKDQSMDLVLAENAMPGFDSEKGEEMRSSVQNSFDEIIRVLKPGGEARLYPIYLNECEQSRRPLVEEIEKKLAELRKNKNLEITIQEVRKLPSSLAEDAIQETYGRIIVKKINTENSVGAEQKEAVIEQKRKEIDQFADVEGKGIDEEIKNTIVALNLAGFPTTQSCHGHCGEIIDGKRMEGFGSPWVQIELADRPKERFPNENAIFQKVAQKYGLSIEDLKDMEKNPEPYWEAIKEMSQQEETPEYQEWKRKNEELLQRAKELLDEFYKIREGGYNEDTKLQIEEFTDMFRIHNGGADYKMVDENISESEKISHHKRLLKYQREMRYFADFLLNKFRINEKI